MHNIMIGVGICHMRQKMLYALQNDRGTDTLERIVHAWLNYSGDN